ncbi:MAG: hypothetical protein GX446_17930 [Chthonomonadales bacterium]|nr:hypothetical protein [Chthonomonadales bacterium]
MLKHFRELDRILRGDATRITALRRGTIETPVGGLALISVVLGMLYGLCAACFALFKPGGPSYMQVVASMVKVPMLFYLTLVVTLPSLYVFNALVGSRLTFQSVLRLLVAAMAVLLAVLASLGPIVAFFSVSSTSYAFMLLFNVAVCGVAGALGMKFLLQTLHRLSIARSEDASGEAELPDEPDFDLGPRVVAEPAQVAQAAEPQASAPAPWPPVWKSVGQTGALTPVKGRKPGSETVSVFRTWVIVFGLVGMQMSWVLRPIIGAPHLPFAWFRPRESSFFEAVLNALYRLLG